MTMVAMMVIAAPLIVELIVPKSAIETLPLTKTKIAPPVAGMASFRPFGRQRIRINVSIKPAFPEKM